MTKQEAIQRSIQVGGLTSDLEKETLWDLAMQYIPSGGIAVEVGTWTGGSAVIIGEVCRQKQAKLICIDGFTTDMDGVRPPLSVPCFGAAVEHTRGLPIYWMVGDSNIIFNFLRPGIADFVFIDGNHYSPGVDLDIAGYKPLVKKGGLYCGHDYRTDQFQVKEVVDRELGSVLVTDTIWQKVI